MLPSPHRLRDSAGFDLAVRRGRRAGGRLLVVHAQLDARSGPARVGFVVSRGVGNAVTRNRVKRRLRHLVRDRLGSIPPSCAVVVRANPAAATASWSELGAALGVGLDRALTAGRRVGTAVPAGSS